MRLNGVLFVDGRSWNILFLNSSVFRKLSWENFWSVFVVFFLTISDLESCSFSVNDWLKNALLINSSSWNWNLSLSNFSFSLNSLEDGLKFLFFDIWFINVDFLVYGVVFGLDISVIFNFVSWNGDVFLNFLIWLLSR